ncbi:RNase adapter RapZ [Dermatobacter hominis]|uniref:RNase adapter RapZ n=1 Tax=Dermatobacter hominis TaxID=2884263 RepID=UPI001D112730|nr:RNase adapter RapZ [Dermatobacter hominis]UDY36748.1 RNase adapter RapZ [Dermatobacter hominis]
MSEFLVITGVSGAGRTQFGDSLEDLGWFVIDNIPVELIPKVAELARFQDPGTPVALVVGTGSDIEGIGPALDELRRSGAGVRIVFLDASTPTLVRRYGESKRRHPLAAQAGTVAGAIDLERDVLAEVREAADIVLDTSDLNVHDLRARVNELFADDGGSRMQVTLQSFGYKHGVPADVDTVFDCRFLPNPYWVDELRPLTGLDPEVQDYVRSFELTGEFLHRVEDLLELLLPAYVAEGKALLTVAFGCTGGRHRSVTIVETVADWLRAQGIEPRIRHRDVAK